MRLVSPTFTVGGTQTAPEAIRLPMHGIHHVELRCVACTATLTVIPYDSMAQPHEPVECRRCSAALAQKHGIWLALPKNRQAYFERFLRDYATVRKAEGRGSDNPDFYLSLPYRDQTKSNSRQWAVRSRTYKYIERKIVPRLTQNTNRPLAILDLGAGNGWMSYRLAKLGHRAIAVDLQTNTFDGLGAAVHYQRALPMLFPRFQAELDELPFGSGQFDCAIFNASFHYSQNYDRTLSEAIRCLRPEGTIIIADSPSYSHEEWGQKMLAQRRQLFQKQFGFTSDGLGSCEYLTKDRLLALEVRHDLKWKTHSVWYGIRWACRPLVASLKGQREPSQFRTYTAKVKTR
jgi:ubiquinone/menaquinone biosynthesis C-methylase UbiE